MRYELSKFIGNCKTQKTFDKWVDGIKEEAKSLAYEKRGSNDRRSIENDLSTIDTLKKAYKPIKALRKKSEAYDVIVKIDGNGYVTMFVTFPIAEKELQDAIEKKRIEREETKKKWGWDCSTYSTDEALWDMLHENVYKVFSFASFNHNGMHYFEKYGDNLVRRMDIFQFK